MIHFYHFKHLPRPDLQNLFDPAKAVKALAKSRIGKKVVINSGSLGTDVDKHRDERRAIMPQGHAIIGLSTERTKVIGHCDPEHSYKHGYNVNNRTQLQTRLKCEQHRYNVNDTDVI